MAKAPDMLDEIIAQLDPEEVPTEFIVMAKVTTVDGQERFVTGAELEAVMENPEEHGVAEVRIILDAHKVRDAITQITEAIFAEVHALGLDDQNDDHES